MSGTKASAETQAVEPGGVVTPLTLPCTALQLRNWLLSVDVIRPGNNAAQVTASASSISIA